MRLPKIGGIWRKLKGERLPATALSPPYTLQHLLDTLRYPPHSHVTLDISQTLPKAALDTYKHSCHSTDIICHPHFSQSPPGHPVTNQMPHKLSDECLEVAKAFPGRLVRVFGVPGGVLKCPGMFWECWRVYPCFERYLGAFSTQFPPISMVH